MAGSALLAPLASDGREALCDIPVVQTRSGPLCGRAVEAAPPGGEKRALQAYLGIPYAAPPIGARRWRAPAPAEPWQGIRRSDDFGPICPQHLPEDVSIETSEDCLTLNVWTPDPKGALPVMVFLHGGSFLDGGSSLPLYDGAHLAATGPVVVVTLNYRLGVLGFLAGIDGFGGNYGILDQQLALRWVRENAAAFGGDPARVTLWGESAGAMSVGIHLLDEESAKLFRAAILESDPYGIPYKTPEQARGYANAVVAALGCSSDDDDDDVSACLRDAPIDRILEAQMKPPFTEALLLGLPSFVPWAPVVGSPPLAMQPVQGRIDKPMILGTNTDEGTLFVALQERAIGSIGAIKYVLETELALGDHAGKARALYPPLGPGGDPEALSHLVTDYLFTCASRFVLGRSTAPAWSYEFRYAPSFSIWPSFPVCAPSTGRVCHGAELPFVFGNPFPPVFGEPRASFTTAEEKLARTTMQLWTRFATDFDPSPTGDPPWPRYEGQNPVDLRLTGPLTVGPPRDAHCEFWDALGYDLSGVLDRILRGDRKS